VRPTQAMELYLQRIISTSDEGCKLAEFKSERARACPEHHPRESAPDPPLPSPDLTQPSPHPSVVRLTSSATSVGPTIQAPPATIPNTPLMNPVTGTYCSRRATALAYLCRY